MSRGNSPESREAMRFGEKDRLRAVALEYIRRSGELGATADECCASLNLCHNSVAPRIVELKQSRLIVELYNASGKRVRRQTRAGCAAGVVVAVEFAPSKAGPAASVPGTHAVPVASAPSLFGDIGRWRDPEETR
jgi:hypothetical protein